ncbi:uncharacterized protein LOC110842076 [Folsomia candida]|uniref:Uncharacterized protein n=1 Tax=Folsomia candida TaxID=158441 RepID=A0A226F189_FOLCA|nr:uncharacterized protein LOC110842076 [Folsomia candida]OXA63194.1 hypothetical protein Fcan01_00187 [Folsomia candida]
MSIIAESSICIVSLDYAALPATVADPLPASAAWWSVQIDGLETVIMKNAMKSEYPELKDNAHHRLVFYSPEEEAYFPIINIVSKTTQYLNAVANLGYRLTTSTIFQDINSGVVHYQYCLQK